jgi:hypothetical protein
VIVTSLASAPTLGALFVSARASCDMRVLPFVVGLGADSVQGSYASRGVASEEGRGC